MRLAVLGRLAVLVALAATLSGCWILFPTLYGEPFPVPSYPGYPDDPDFSFDPDDPFRPEATFTSGTATITITQGGESEAIDLDLTHGGITDGYADGTWRTTDGWMLTVSGTAGASYYGDSYVSLERVTQNQFWGAETYDECTVTLDEASADGLKGTARCWNLRWTDGLEWGGPPDYLPIYVEGEDPFDAQITFEARP